MESRKLRYEQEFMMFEDAKKEADKLDKKDKNETFEDNN